METLPVFNVVSLSLLLIASDLKQKVSLALLLFVYQCIYHHCCHHCRHHHYLKCYTLINVYFYLKK